MYKNYGKIDYWEREYSQNGIKLFDWYQTYNGIKDIITQYMTKKSKILNVGCGNSKMTEDMVIDGFNNIVSIDLSQAVISQMEELYDGKNMDYRVMDVRQMDFPDGQFDVVIDKATLDSILVTFTRCGYASRASAHQMISEIYRVLSRNGIYICVSYGIPKSRLIHLVKPEFNWNVVVHNVYKPVPGTNKLGTSIMISETEEEKYPTEHYVYVCKKRD